MCEIETVIIVAAFLLAATGFCIHQANSETKVRQDSKIKSEGPCENEYNKYCMNEC